MDIIGRPVKLAAYIDSRSVFDVIAKDGNTTEKRLQIDIFAVPQSYKNVESVMIRWVPDVANPIDALTTIYSCTSSIPLNFMKNNRLNFDYIGWTSFRKNYG